MKFEILDDQDGTPVPKEGVMKVAPLDRSLNIEKFTVQRQEGGNTRLTFTASSEYPVERFFGTEILDHSPGSIRMDRVKAGAVPLLFNHDMDDVIGMVDDLRLMDRRLVSDAHFFSTSRANEIDQMVEGGLRNVSIRYRIHTVEVDKNGDERVIDWEPLEVSIVSIPADPTVGMGRAVEGQPSFEAMRILAPPESPAVSAETPKTQKQEKAMSEESRKADEVEADEGNTAERKEESRQPRVEVEERQPRSDDAIALERQRREGITNLCKANRIDDKIRDLWIGQGISLTEVSKDLLRIIEERGNTNPEPASKLGMSPGETQRYSLQRAIRACAENDWSAASFELDCSRQVAAKLNKAPSKEKFFVPFDVMNDPKRITPGAQRHLGQRDLSTGAGGGGFLVETDNMGFIEFLRNRSVAFRMGTRRMSGLQGDVTIPRQSAAATAYWLGNETTQITESAPTIVQIALSPKNVGAYTEISRQLLLQSSPDAEGVVTADLARVVATAADLAVLNGSGASGQPEGILQTSGIGSVTGTSLGFAGVLEFQSDVATANVEPTRGGYVTTPAVASLMAQRVKFSNTASPLWDGNLWDGNMCGFPAMSSNQMPAATMLFGDFSDTIVGEWGVLEVEVNPYANFQAGIIGVRAIYSLDVAVTRPFSYSSASSIT